MTIEEIRDKHQSECGCEECIDMCKNRPCWGTPFEIRKLIEAGYADRLYLDWWVGGFDGGSDNLYMPQPAMVEREKGYAPDSFWPRGRCTFLNDEDQCEIHSLKPVEGIVASHDNRKEMDELRLHELTARSWDTELGREVLADWKKQVGFDGED